MFVGKKTVQFIFQLWKFWKYEKVLLVDLKIVLYNSWIIHIHLVNAIHYLCLCPCRRKAKPLSNGTDGTSNVKNKTAKATALLKAIQKGNLSKEVSVSLIIKTVQATICVHYVWSIIFRPLFFHPCNLYI